jgi:hypothetical protein
MEIIKKKGKLAGDGKTIPKKKAESYKLSSHFYSGRKSTAGQARKWRLWGDTGDTSNRQPSLTEVQPLVDGIVNFVSNQTHLNHLLGLVVFITCKLLSMYQKWH